MLSHVYVGAVYYCRGRGMLVIAKGLSGVGRGNWSGRGEGSTAREGCYMGVGEEMISAAEISGGRVG